MVTEFLINIGTDLLLIIEIYTIIRLTILFCSIKIKIECNLLINIILILSFIMIIKLLEIWITSKCNPKTVILLSHILILLAIIYLILNNLSNIIVNGNSIITNKIKNSIKNIIIVYYIYFIVITIQGLLNV